MRISYWSSDVCSSELSAIAASWMAMMRTSFGGTGRPTQVPAPVSVAARVACNSAPSITATGRHSGAPYGVHSLAPSGNNSTEERSGGKAVVMQVRYRGWRDHYKKKQGQQKRNT